MEVVNRHLMNGTRLFLVRNKEDAEWLTDFLEKYFPETKYRYDCDSREELLHLIINESICFAGEVCTITPEIFQLRGAHGEKNGAEEVALYFDAIDIDEAEYYSDVTVLVSAQEDIPESTEDIASFFF